MHTKACWVCASDGMFEVKRAEVDTGWQRADLEYDTGDMRKSCCRCLPFSQNFECRHDSLSHSVFGGTSGTVVPRIDRLGKAWLLLAQPLKA